MEERQTTYLSVNIVSHGTWGSKESRRLFVVRLQLLLAKGVGVSGRVYLELGIQSHVS
jgi:hypothetical protein